MSEPETYRMIVGWEVFRPDTRQYKQQSIEIKLVGVGVAVDIPASLVVSASETSVVLTIKGMRYVQEQFESVFNDAPAAESVGWDDAQVVAHEPPADDWGAVVAEPAADESWDAEPATSTDGTENDWGETSVFTDEPGNTPDSDVWNEEQEDWN